MASAPDGMIISEVEDVSDGTNMKSAVITMSGISARTMSLRK